ncbi:RlpA-like double-psi beta-barrel-protein domain-containing protein-containing protein [Lactarius tabidus]
MHSFTTLLLALSVPLHALAAHSPLRRHDALAHRARGDLLPRQSYDNVRITFYEIDVGTTSCGGNFQNSDFVFALDSSLYGSGYPGPNCGRSISLTCNGKTATAVLQDECPGCPYGGLDLTEGLFSYFADMSVGVLTCSWYYTDGSGNGGSTPSSSSSYTPAYTPQDTPTYSPSPTPTPTPTPEYTPTTSSTPPPPPTTSSTPTSYPPPSPTTSTTPTTSSTPTSSPPPSPTPSPSPSPTPNTNTGSGSDDGQNLSGMNDLISNYANIVEDCNGD